MLWPQLCSFLCIFSGDHQQEKTVYKGVYSDWSIEQEDVREVIAYRAGLNVAALGESHLRANVQLGHVQCKLTYSVCWLQPCWWRQAYVSHLQALYQMSGKMQWLQLVSLAWVSHCTWCICTLPQSSASCRWVPGDSILRHALILQPLCCDPTPTPYHGMQGLYGVGAAGALGLALSQVTAPLMQNTVTAFCLPLTLLGWALTTAGWAGGATVCC